MDKLKPSLTPGFLIAFSILCIAFALFFIMAVVTATSVHAQQRPLQCVRMEQLMRGMTEVLHEQKIWQGIKATAGGPIETFLFQSEDGKTWTQVDVVGKDENGKPIGCFVGVGTNGNPNELGKGV